MRVTLLVITLILLTAVSCTSEPTEEQSTATPFPAASPPASATWTPEPTNSPAAAATPAPSLTATATSTPPPTPTATARLTPTVAPDLEEDRRFLRDLECAEAFFTDEIVDWLEAEGEAAEAIVMQVTSTAEVVQRTADILHCDATVTQSSGVDVPITYWYELGPDGRSPRVNAFRFEYADPAPLPVQGFGDGTWSVNRDIPPDLYMALGGEDCGWTRLSGLYGTDEDVISEMPPAFRDLGWNSLRQVVNIDSSDAAFRTEGCGEWRPVSELMTPVKTIPDGIWVVGEEIPIGTYASMGGDKCLWFHFNGFDWSTDALLAVSSNAGRQIVDLKSSASILFTVGCGEWRPLSEYITPVDAIPDGVWVVGDEVELGVYASAGGTNCFWGRLQELDGYFLEQGRGAGRQIVEIEDGDRAFGTEGCSEWRPLSESITPVDVIPDGAWVVGQEVAPRIYSSAGPNLDCKWRRLSGWKGPLSNFGELIGQGWGAGRNLVEIKKTDVGFFTTGCADWLPVEQAIIPLTTIPAYGVWLVGEEITPGVWSAPGGVSCHWARRSGFGFGDGIIGNGSGSGTQTVAIEPTDLAFSSSGCGEWTPGLEPVVLTMLIPDGTWRVGEALDVAPGIYAAEGQPYCHWERLGGYGGGWEDRLGSGPYGRGVRAIVEVQATDVAFKTENCGQWMPIAQAINPVTTIPDGTWLVGEEVSPGIYAAPGGSSGIHCQWTRLKGFGGSFTDRVSGQYGRGRQLVEIKESHVGFGTYGCGEWTPVSEVATVLTSIEDGIWLVGEEVTPGTWEAPSSRNCYWARLTSLSRYESWGVEEGGAFGEQVVEIEETDTAFLTEGCGTWTRL